MGKSLFVTSGAQLTTTANTTYYYAIGNAASFRHLTETNRQIKMRAAGVLSKLYFVAVTNATSATSTVRTRKNGVDGAMSVSIGAGATGEFEDTTNTDTIAVNDLLCYQIVTGAGGVIDFVNISSIFTPTTSGLTYTPLVSVNTANATIATQRAIRHQHLSGELYFSGTTEDHLQSEVRIAGTLKALSVFIAANPRSTTTTFRIKKNGADGNQVVSVVASATGLIDDLTNTDTVAAGDLLNTELEMGTGSGGIQVQYIKVDFETSSGDSGLLINGYVFGFAQNATTTNYANIAGRLDVIATETTRKVKVREAFTFSNLGARIQANSLNATSSIRLRKNGADGNQVVSITAAATGWLEDTTNSDVCVGTDEVNYSIVPGGGSGTMNIRSMYMVTTLATSVVASEVANKVLTNKFITKV